jgi:glycine betaine/choline ABC-type transport system substrate-binding protein
VREESEMRPRLARLRAAATVLLTLALSLSMVACGSSDDSGSEQGSIFPSLENGRVSLTIGSKNFPEQEILGEIYAQALEAAGYKVKTDLSLGSETAAYQAVKNGTISGYPESASTALTSFFGIKPEDVSTSLTRAAEQANEEFDKEGLTAYGPTDFAPANAVGTTTKFAEEKGLKTIFDLKGQSKDMVLYGPPGCRQRIDCLARLEKLYGLKFKSFHPVDPDLRYKVLENGQAELSILSSTDPQLFAEKNKFVILKAEWVLPASNIIFVSKKSTAEKAGPAYERTIFQVQQGLTLEVMQGLNLRVELEKETPKEAAAAYLELGGYVE